MMIRLWRSLRFLGSFGYQLVKANIEIAIAVLSPTLRFRPGIIAFSTRCKTDLEVTLLSNAISLTPGTLVVDVSADHKTLYVHAMFAQDKAGVVRSIRNDLEKPLLEILS